MGLLDRLLRRKATEGDEQRTEVATPPCLHTALGPRWANAADMGDESKASSYICEVCGETFTREEGDRLRAEEAERLKARLSTDN